MSKPNRPNTRSKKKCDEEEIELEEPEDPKSLNTSLIQRAETTTQLRVTTRKKDLIVHFQKEGKYRSFLKRMSKGRNYAFGLILLLAILMTYGITNYTNRSGQLKCPLSIDNNQIESSLPVENTTIIYRLPTNLVPISYDLKIKPFLRPSKMYFDGSVSILVNCKEPTKQIQLNVNELRIFFEQIYVQNETSKVLVNVSSIHSYNEILNFRLHGELKKKENYTIFIPFRGNLTTSLTGFYRSSYTDTASNETRYLAMTQFQATDARRAFPCFDEPLFKATFDIEITHWKNMTAISNMPIISKDEINSSWVKTKFAKTVKMSTYLVAFAVGDFAFMQDLDNVPKYRIATRPSENEYAREAILFGSKILAHFEKYFKLKFPLPKIDMLATPDFSAGAMENWGLITYREAYLLFNEKVGSIIQLYRISSVIAHELAHQWSGNLVTPTWWDGLWLNEGFATFMSYEGVNAVKPNWRIWQRFVLDEVHDVMNLDSLKSTHPISVKVNDPNEISELFDHISYSKGASIIKMMTHIIGEETFKEGMHTYLNEFKYGNAEQDDLWKHLQDAHNKISNDQVNVKKIMDSWTLNEGYPLITIIRNYETKEIRFSQKRFLLNSNETDELVKTQYEVPISYTTKSESDWSPETKIWLHKTEDQSESFAVIKSNLSNDDWLIANLQETGYYRVTYDENNWELLVNQLLKNHTAIHLINRAQILDDLFHLAENGVVKYSLALKALEYFRNENDPLPWTSFGHLTHLTNRMLRRTEIYGSWRNYIRELVKIGYEKYKLDKLVGDDLQKSQMQRSMASIACAYNLNSCVQSSTKLFKQFMENVKASFASKSNPIPPNVRSAVYCSAIYHGDESEWDFIFDLFKKEQNANERNAMLSALTCSRVPWILARYLKYAFNETSGVKTQDATFVFKGIATQNYGKDIAFNFLRENWEKIYSIHGRQMSFAHIVKSLDSINSEFELDLVKTFYISVKNKLGSAKRAFAQTIEQIESNVVWMQKYESEIAEFLEHFENQSKLVKVH